LYGTLNIGGTISFQVGSDFLDNVNGTGGAGELNISGAVTIASGADINLNIAGTLTSGDVYTLAVAPTGSFSGTNGGFTLGAALPSGWGIVATGGGADLVLEQVAGSNATNAYFNGATSDLGTAANFDSTPTANDSAAGALAAGSNVFFSANRNTNTSATISSNLEVNSVNFGTGTGTNSGITLSSTNGSTLQIDATNANGNTAGNGITVAGSGSNTISAPVALGGNQSWTTASGSTLTVSGQVSNGTNGAASLTKAGLGAVVLSSPAGNTYSGGTTINAGSFYVTNTSGSATGTGAVSVNNTGTVLAGTGKIGGAVTLGAGTTLYSGGVPTGSPTVSANSSSSTTGLTLGSSLTINSANLTFALGTDTTSSAQPYNFATPSFNSAYASVNGVVSFSGTNSISLVDLTNRNPTGANGGNGSLTLRTGTPYVLIADSLGDAGFSGLVTAQGFGSNTTYSLDGNGYVVGVAGAGWVPADGATDVTAIQINQYAADGTTPLAAGTGGIYAAPALYLNNGDLEVVPEPGTWALMIGGLALLLVIQRRKRI
jgi:hypothetical protein